MFVRIAYDPGPTFQQRLHQTDFEMPDGVTDAAAIREAHRRVDSTRKRDRLTRRYGSIVCIAVWDGADWRTIEGSFPF